MEPQYGLGTCHTWVHGPFTGSRAQQIPCSIHSGKGNSATALSCKQQRTEVRRKAGLRYTGSGLDPLGVWCSNATNVPTCIIQIGVPDPAPSNYPKFESKYHHTRTIRFYWRVVGGPG